MRIVSIGLALWLAAGVAMGGGLFAPGPADAFPFGRGKAKEAATPRVQNPGVRPAIEGPGTPVPDPAAETSPRAGGQSAQGRRGQARAAPAARPAPPATAAERQAARRLDLVAQSTFWLGELAKNAADAEAAVEASTVLRRIGSFERATEVAAIGLQSHETDGRLWAAMGHGLLGQNQGGPAVQALQRAIQFAPGEATLHTALGIAYDMVERPDLARPSYLEALRLRPDDSVTLTNLGLSQALAGSLPEAEATLRRAAANPLAPPQARQNLALVVGLQGRFEESERLAAADLPPAVAAENVATLRRMLNGGDSRWTRARGEGG
jgi:Flp pilus assembly protein TadD